jgi:transcriptional regulator with XRE-family HTH domain
MRTTEYLTAAKAKTSKNKSIELAKLLGVTSGAMSHYESGKRIIDDYTAMKLAKILGIDPLRIIAQANAEREKNEKKRAFWTTIASKGIAAMVTAFIFGTTFLPTNTAEANIHKKNQQLTDITTSLSERIEIMRTCGASKNSSFVHFNGFPT